MDFFNEIINMIRDYEQHKAVWLVTINCYHHRNWNDRQNI